MVRLDTLESTVRTAKTDRMALLVLRATKDLLVLMAPLEKTVKTDTTEL